MNYQHNRSNSGGRKGGFNRGNGFSRRSESFDTTCAECGNSCTVPFKPNGRKPVLCSNCFRQDEGGDRGSFDRSDRKPFRTFKKPSFDRRPSNDGVENELKQIRKKLDRILDILNEVTVEEVDQM